MSKEDMYTFPACNPQPSAISILRASWTGSVLCSQQKAEVFVIFLKLEEDLLFHVSFLSDSPMTQHSYSLMARKTGWILAEVVRLDSGCFRVGPVGNGFCFVLSPSAANSQTLFWVCISSISVRVYYFDCDLLMENPALQVEGKATTTKTAWKESLWKDP